MPPCTKIQISLGSSAFQSFDEVRKLSEESAQSSPSNTILEQREIDLGGLPALWSKIENKSISEYPMIQVLILMDDSLIALNAYGELEPVEGILASIMAIE